MLRFRLALAGLLAFGCIATARADEFAGQWFIEQAARSHSEIPKTSAKATVSKSRTVGAPMRLSGAVPEMIARHVSATIGQRWVSTALRIAKIESGFRCNARNGRAVGAFQNTNPQMFGVSRAAALTCEGGIHAGVAHMALCIRKGAASESMMMRCHNSGSPWGRVDRVYRIALRG